MAKTLTLTGKDLTTADVAFVARAGGRVAIRTSALANARRSKRILDRVSKTLPVYGVNTGFGPMASRLIGTDDIQTLQVNLVRSHACGMGEPVPEQYVRAAMLVRLNTLLRGYSGVSEGLLLCLRDMLNAGISPVVPERGGVGASGDLIQLAHIALGVVGEGEVFYKGKRVPAARAFSAAGCKPHVLQAKEGLALINGTSYMAGVASLVIEDTRRLLSVSVRSGALALEAVHGFADALSPELHAARPHPGQVRVAAILRALTAGSKLVRPRSAFTEAHTLSKDTHELDESAQDVYSIRCIPQIVGPVVETYADAKRVVTVELNAATDNPLISSGGAFLHGGNFHGEYVAAAMDKMKAGMAKLSMLSERRINMLLNAAVNKRFAPFLNLDTPGLTLGLQGLQFVATSTAARNQSLAYPHSLHSIPSNGDNQDVVSMGADAAHAAMEVLHNTRIVCAIELAAVSQAFACSGEEKKASSAARLLLAGVRGNCPPMKTDRSLRPALTKIAAWIAATSELVLEF